MTAHRGCTQGRDEADDLKGRNADQYSARPTRSTRRHFHQNRATEQAKNKNQQSSDKLIQPG